MSGAGVPHLEQHFEWSTIVLPQLKQRSLSLLRLTLLPDGLQDIQLLVADRIKKIRRAKSITQDQLAELAGLNRTHLYRLESGKQSMTLRTLKIIAEALGVKVGALVKGL